MARHLAPVSDSPPRAIIYTRVSAVMGRGDDLTSPAIQEHACRDFCARRGYVVTEVLTDIDRSGRSWSKRQVEGAVKRIEAGEAEKIVTWRFSRFTRNLRDYVIQTARIEAAGGQLESALEETDPATAAGLLQRDLFAILAQWESRKIAEGWRETHARRRREGMPHTNFPRLGYRIVDKRYVVDSESAPLVVEMFRRYLAGEGYRQVAEWLNSLAVPHPRSGRPWQPSGARRVMESGWPAGLLFVDGEYLPGAHEAIVDERLWRAYLRERERRRKVPARLIVPVSALSGLVVCSGCGRSMRIKRFTNHQGTRGNGRPRHRQPTYACETFGCPRRCHVSVPLAVTAVLDWLRPMVADVEVSEATRAADSASRTVAKGDRKRLERALAKLDAEMVRQTRDLASGLVLPAHYRAARDDAAADRRRLVEALAACEETVVRPPPTRQVVRRLLDGWDASDELGRNRALRDLVWKVEVSPPLVPHGRGAEGRSLIRPFGLWERQ